MAANVLKNKVDTLRLSEKAFERLRLSGIDIIDDFNTFNLKELKMLLEDSFEEIVKVLKKYTLPASLVNLNLSEDILEVLKNARINNFDELVKYDKRTLYQLFSEDQILLSEINNFFAMYEMDILVPFVEGQTSYHIEDEDTKALDIDIEARKRIKVEQSRKSYGSRAFSHFKIRLASPHEIRQWSYGEVLNHETINYRTSKPEVGGLFCERIFGPTKDYQCACGTKKQSGNKGQVCPKCGIEITESKVRRERMGHIELEAPVVHTWYIKNSPSRIAILLGIKAKELEEVVYHASYIVTDPGTAPLTKKQILSEQQFSELSHEYRRQFVAQTGAEAIKVLLKELDLEKEVKILRKAIKTTSTQRREKAIRRLEVVEAFNNSDNKPEWMVMDVIPVIPPDLRPMVALDGGRFATTDLNDLYRRILNRNNRLKKQKEQGAPRLILKNEKRMLQEAFDALIDNSKRGRKAAVERGRNLKSLSDMLRGKQGRLRQNLLGKRVDYSGRSVIIVGPNLEMHQCGIPRQMAIILFKPFVLRELYNQGLDKKNANAKYESMDDDVWSALEKVVVEHPVLLNRAPTLHRLGIQAFEPKLIDGKAITLHPLVTPAFNADFDGDQMAVHVPLSNEAQAEARLLMLASNNILNPKDGKPVVTPSQDMVLGNYYLTIEEALNRANIKDPKLQERHLKLHRNEGRFFYNVEEANYAYENHEIALHTRIIVNTNNIKQNFKKEDMNKYLITTIGKLIFNQVLPESFNYLQEPTMENLEEGVPSKYFLPKGTNPKDYLDTVPLPKPFNKNFLSEIIARVFKMLNISETSKILDKVKDLGFKYSTIAGISISHADINVYSGKKAIIDKTLAELDSIEAAHEDGLLTEEERRRLVISQWEQTNSLIKDGVTKELDEDNHIYMMTDSGARGSIGRFVQLSGMRGLMRNPKGEIIEVPVQASFKEGLTVSEFFISTHGARKGSTDTALKTAESGYLTRRLVDVSQEVIVVEEDCGSEKGTIVGPIYDDNNIIVTLEDRIIGRYASRPVIHPKNKKQIVDRNELITEEIAEEIIKAGIEKVEIRTVLNSVSDNGVSAKSYGRNLATNTPVEIGDAVGVVAAQSIGEPGTQLTMRTFHTGGVASASDITQGLPRIQELFEARKPKGEARLSEVNGRVEAIKGVRNKQREITVIEDQKDKTLPLKEYKYIIDPNTDLYVKKGDRVVAGEKLSAGSINPKELLRVVSAEAAQNYILEEVQKVYRAQKVDISDKHIEIIIRQMFRRLYVVHEGDSILLPGTETSVTEFKNAVKEMMTLGLRLPVARPILLGITRASLRSDSFLSAASFQETTKILTDAAVRGNLDELHGLKENVIIGGLIPAGTGILTHKEFNYDAPVNDDEYEEDYY